MPGRKVLAISSALNPIQACFLFVLDSHSFHFFKIWKTALDTTIYTSNMSLKSVSEDILT